jgi:hypothetical protein
MQGLKTHIKNSLGKKKTVLHPLTRQVSNTLIDVILYLFCLHKILSLILTYSACQPGNQAEWDKICVKLATTVAANFGSSIV